MDEEEVMIDEGDEDMSDEENEWLRNRNEPHERCGHVAVRFSKYIVVFAGYTCTHSFLLHNQQMLHQEEYLSNRVVWMYDLDSEEWKCKITKGEECPPGTSGACGVVIGRDIYMQGGHTGMGNTNDIWKLSRVAQNHVSWTQIKIGNTTTLPSPRDKHVGWEYDEKLWTFGGFGPPPNGYLNDYGDFITEAVAIPQRGWNNQLHCFDPEHWQWANLLPNGAVPSPRAAHAIAPVKDKAYLFGGRNGPVRLDDMYQLDMVTLTFTQIQTSGPSKPVGRSWHSFTAVANNQIVLHGGYSTEGRILNDTWILDMPSFVWRPYTATSDHPRLWHTGTKGLSSIIIFGGTETDLLDQNIPSKMCRDVFQVSIKPKTLLKQCLKAVYSYRDRLQSEWECLPGNLYEELSSMITENKQQSSANNEDDRERGVTICSIS